MRWWISILWLLGASAAPAAPAEQRVALVVGNGDYRHVGALRNPVNDARAVAAALARVGFEVILTTDADQAALRGAARRFSRALEGAEVGLFYYSGHGLQVGGENYLAPVDARLSRVAELDFETVPLRLVLSQLTRDPRVGLVFLDACRDNPLAESLGHGRSVTGGRGLARVETGVGTLIAYATAPGRIAADGRGDHSPFTAALLRHLERPGLEVRQLMTRVRSEVIRVTEGRQVPWDHSSLVGDFHFVSAPGSDDPAPPGPVSASPPAPSPQRGSLTVESRPPGAAVWVNGGGRGVAPVNLEGVAPGSVVVELRKPGYRPARRTVTVHPGQCASLTVDLEAKPRPGAVAITTRPRQARWFLDDVPMGRTPTTLEGVTPGRYRLDIRKPGYLPWTGRLTIPAGGTARLSADLEPDPSVGPGTSTGVALTVRARPADARVVLLDGHEGYYPGVRLVPGVYRLRVERPGYRAVERRVALVETGREQVVEFELEPLAALDPGPRALDSDPRALDSDPRALGRPTRPGTERRWAAPDAGDHPWARWSRRLAREVLQGVEVWGARERERQADGRRCGAR